MFALIVAVVVAGLGVAYFLSARRSHASTSQTPTTNQSPTIQTPTTIQSPTIHVVGLRLYPVKSCAPVEVEEAVSDRRGFRYDRRFVIVDAATGKQLTQRQCPRLAFIQPLIFPDVNLLQLTARGVDSSLLLPLEFTDESNPPSSSSSSPSSSSSSSPSSPFTPASLPSRASDYGRIQVDCWGWQGDAAHMGEAAARWLSTLLGRDVVLARQLDDVIRPCVSETVAAVCPDGDVVSFADGFPYLLTSMQSLAGVNEWIADDNQTAVHVQMRRFRPNIIVSGGPALPAWDEESWKRLRLTSPIAGRPAVELTNQKLCGRCILTTVDPDKGELTKPAVDKNGQRKSGGEPLITLLQHQKKRLGAAYFGINLVAEHVSPQHLITVGSTVTVISRGQVGQDIDS